MHSFPRWKYGLILAELVISLMGSLPNFTTPPSWWPTALSSPMSLGLDLKGGIHLVLDVDVDKAVSHSVEEDIDTARQGLRKERIRYAKLASDNNSMTIVLKQETDADAARKILNESFNSYDITNPAANTFILNLQQAAAKEIEKFAVDQAIEVIRGRIDALGTTEPVIIRQGQRRILVQIPGYEDTAHAKQLIGRTAQLEFKLVDEKGYLDKALSGRIPPGEHHTCLALDRLAMARTIVSPTC